MKSNKTYTTRQAGRYCGVDLTTVINWIKAGKIKAFKTAGGHRRIEHDDLIEFMTAYNIPISKELMEITVLKILLVSSDPYIIPLIKAAVNELYNRNIIDIVSEDISLGYRLASEKHDIVVIDNRTPGISVERFFLFLKREYTEPVKTALLTGSEPSEALEELADISSPIPMDAESFKTIIKALLADEKS